MRKLFNFKSRTLQQLATIIGICALIFVLHIILSKLKVQEGLEDTNTKPEDTMAKVYIAPSVSESNDPNGQAEQNLQKIEAQVKYSKANTAATELTTQAST